MDKVMTSNDTIITFARHYNDALSSGKITAETTLMGFIAEKLHNGLTAINPEGHRVDALQVLTRGYTDEVSRVETERPIRTFKEYMAEKLNTIQLAEDINTL